MRGDDCKVFFIKSQQRYYLDHYLDNPFVFSLFLLCSNSSLIQQKNFMYIALCRQILLDRQCVCSFHCFGYCSSLYVVFDVFSLQRTYWADYADYVYKILKNEDCTRETRVIFPTVFFIPLNLIISIVSFKTGTGSILKATQYVPEAFQTLIWIRRAGVIAHQL